MSWADAIIYPATAGFVGCGYQGQRAAEVSRGITVDDAAWWMSSAERLGEQALAGRLLASGVDQAEAARFARALINRIQQIADVCQCVQEEPQRTIKAG